ncbi:DEAD/DEAH box helicase family protein [Burkholderia gladioli]|uniref:DEAD/DEAH box helicase family protein n=1 Tax=Burkholderia gladioli TaxID=28095 RepID=UPI003B511392
MSDSNSLNVVIAHNAVVAKLHQAHRDVKLAVQSILSYKVADADNNALVRSGKWDGRSSFFDFRMSTFPAGFVTLVAAHLRRRGYTVSIAKKPLPELRGPERPVIDQFGYADERYNYQPEVVDTLVKHGQIIAQVATGGGKSRIARMAYARINRPTLFLTTRSILMYQMKDAFERDMGIPVSVLGDGEFGDKTVNAEGRTVQSIKRMTVGMVQTLVARLAETTFKDEYNAIFCAQENREEKLAEAEKKRLKALKLNPDEQKKQLEAYCAQLATARMSVEDMKRKAQAQVKKRTAIREQTINLLSKFEFVIGEEAHEAGGNSYFEILRHCKNAYYRLALTATPFMKDDEEANMRLMASFGPIGYRVSEKLLIDRGILATPSFKFAPIVKRVKGLQKKTAWPVAYRLGIVESEERNDIVIHHAQMAARYGLPVMALVQHKAHGEALLARLRALGLRAAFIYGDNDQDERKAALAGLGAGEYDVLLGTTILDVGVDVPAVGMVILAGGGKAQVALRQRIGRGLRAKKVGPNVCFIVDIDDQFNEHLVGHALQRQQIIRSTPGFAENVLPAGADFDYSAFTLKAA